MLEVLTADFIYFLLPSLMLFVLRKDFERSHTGNEYMNEALLEHLPATCRQGWWCQTCRLAANRTRCVFFPMCSWTRGQPFNHSQLKWELMIHLHFIWLQQSKVLLIQKWKLDENSWILGSQAHSCLLLTFQWFKLHRKSAGKKIRIKATNSPHKSRNMT